MYIQLSEKMSEKVSKLAIDMGMTEDEVVDKIVEWYFEKLTAISNVCSL